MQIIAIGYYSEPHELPEFTEEWENQGHQIIRVATDPLPKERLDPKVDLSIYDMLTRNGGNKMRINAEIGLQRIYFEALAVELMYSENHIDFDECIVFIQQSNDLVFDFEGSDFPVYYNHTQILKPRIPLNANIRGVICAYPGGIEYLEDIHPEVMINVEKTTFIPHGIPKVYMDSGLEFSQRDITIGFKGSISYDGPTEHNWLKKNIYNQRQQYLKDCKRLCESIDYTPGYVEESSNTLNDYKTFMSTNAFAINIPAVPGFVNQRMYHAMSMGCLLIQYKFSGIEELGFVDKLNCLLFSNLKELKNVFKYMKNYTDALGLICRNGIEFAQSQTFTHRARDILKFITKVETLVSTEGTRWVRKEAELLKLKEMGIQ